jgi:type IX secretion system PorP/SprF family membrane protein
MMLYIIKAKVKKVIPFFGVFVVLFSTKSHAQQQPLHTMFWNQYSVYNPAATGVNNTFYAASSSRMQWAKINNRPITQLLLFDYKIDKINSGVGLNYTYDQLGYENSNNINLNYAYHYHLKKDRTLSAGVSFGYEKLSLNYAAFTALSLNDPAIPLKSNYSFFNLGAGLLYQSPHLLIGASATQINEDSGLLYKKSRHVYFCTVGTFNLNAKFQLKPGIYYRQVASESLLEANIRTVYLKRYWLGTTYRVNDAWCFMAGIDIKEKYRISYAYDYFKNKLIGFGATHELGLTLMID